MALGNPTIDALCELEMRFNDLCFANDEDPNKLMCTGHYDLMVIGKDRAALIKDWMDADDSSRLSPTMSCEMAGEFLCKLRIIHSEESKEDSENEGKDDDRTVAWDDLKTQLEERVGDEGAVVGLGVIRHDDLRGLWNVCRMANTDASRAMADAMALDESKWIGFISGGQRLPQLDKVYNVISYNRLSVVLDQEAKANIEEWFTRVKDQVEQDVDLGRHPMVIPPGVSMSDFMAERQAKLVKHPTYVQLRDQWIVDAMCNLKK